MQPIGRRGLTLLELLVVIGIIAILISLLVPAVQRVRAAAARTECSNHLRQLGLAAHQFHDQSHQFPSGMYWQKGKSHDRLSSWLTHLLPYVEQPALWQTTEQAYQVAKSPLVNPPHTGLATVIPVFTCPADGRVLNVQLRHATS